MDQEYLKDLKKDYLKTPIPPFLKQDGWYQLQMKLPPQEKFNWWPLGKTLVLTSLFLFLFATLVYEAPEKSALYLLKTTSNNTFSNIKKTLLNNLPPTLPTPIKKPNYSSTPSPSTSSSQLKKIEKSVKEVENVQKKEKENKGSDSTPSKPSQNNSPKDRFENGNSQNINKGSAVLGTNSNQSGKFSEDLKPEEGEQKTEDKRTDNLEHGDNKNKN